MEVCKLFSNITLCSEEVLHMPVVRLLRRSEVEGRTGLSRSSIYAAMAVRLVPPPAPCRKKGGRLG